MNVLSTVNPFTKYLYAGVALAVVAGLGFSHLTAYRAGRHAVQAKWDEANVAQERAAYAQAESNRELQRMAERRYAMAFDSQHKFFAKATKEIHDAAAPLVSCPLPESVRVRLNAAAACARGDSKAACGAPGQVPSP